VSVYIRFIADRGLISRAIGFRTEGKPSHVEFVVTDDAGIPTSTFGARFKGGITHRPYSYCKPSWEEFYTFAGINASYEEALTLEGRAYDWKDILELLVGWHPRGYDPQEAICSVLVGYSNRRAWARGRAPALINPQVDTWSMTPQLLYGAVTNMVRKIH
jgi:hypothetical protein